MARRNVAYLIAFALLIATATSWAQDITVYITRTGAKYHREGCSSLSRSSIPISLSNAVERGYTPCKICTPPTMTSVAAPEAASSSPRTESSQTSPSLYRVDRPPIRSAAQGDLTKMLATIVSRSIDGDTIEVTIPAPPAGMATLETVRLLGIDTNEISDPNEKVKASALSASAFTRQSLLGKIALLAFESNLRDEYGRVLAYVYLQDGTCHNLELVRLGYARTYTEYPCQFTNELLELEKGARSRALGMWKP
jgi:endonuclease YncB( thermonuclease family)